jgi:copper chaperone CopZ
MTIPVLGMSCGPCALKIEKAVKSLPGVKFVNVCASRGEAKNLSIPPSTRSSRCGREQRK